MPDIVVNQRLQLKNSPSTFTRARSLLVLGALATAALPRSAASAESLPVRVAALTSDSGASPLYALEGGFFEKAGLNVNMTVFSQTSAQTVAAIVGGAVDVGVVDLIQVGNAFNSGFPLAFFAGGTEYSSEAPTTVLCVAKNGRVRTPKDLEGQTVAVNGFGTIQDLSTREWIRKSGATLANVTFVEMPPSAVAAAIERGTVAGAMVSEPFLTSVGDRVARLGNAFDGCAPRFFINCWVASQDWLAKNPEAARRVRTAAYGAAAWSNEHHDLTAPILSKYLKVDPTVVQHMTRSRFATSMAPNMMQPVLDLAWRYGSLKKRLTAADLVARL
jgi:NitT/TauT family transport system substrate-binding protein